ncbi:hypothetical protein ABIC12_000684 [Pantoea agglomerans]
MQRCSGSTLGAGGNLAITATAAQPGSAGNILVQGSQLQAGGDLGLTAKNDISLLSAQNSERTDSTNSSKGGSLGIGLTAGSGGYGISVSASVNAGKGRENGNGLTHTETTLTAGNGLSLNAGRDTTLTGAQVRGDSVKVDTGRNLTLTSEQDSDRYDSKQQNASAGGSFTFGSMTGSASVNLSQDKMHSNWQSVAEQTGIFAGKGGFDVTAGEHTRLNGAVISSTATADKNRLDTGTLGFSNIENHADYKTEHQSVGMSTGGSIGSQFEGNMANGLLAGLNGSGSASSVTKAAVSDGTLIIRDKAKQTQDVADLSRDAAGANPGLDKIFDKDKEQRRMETAQLLAEIGSQAGDIARTQGEIAATRAATEKMKNISPDQKKDAEAQWRKANPGQEPTAADITGQVYQTLYNREMLAGGMGTGGPVQQGISAATAAIQGLAGGNIAQAVSGAAAPYLAEQIHTLTTTKGPDGKEVVNVQANLIAHAVVGAVTSYASGNPALAGASGAAMGEYIAQQMYPGVKREDLSEEQRQTISALGTLAAGLAGGVAGDSTGGAVAGAQAGKNAVENNWLHVNEKTELEIAKQKLRSNDPAEREQAQQKINDLREKDISRDKKVMDACGNGRAASPGCASARLEAYSAKNEYETGNYNNKVSDMYPDAYGQIVSLLNITSVDAQNQQQVKDAMVNYAMTQFGLDKAKAEQYVSTYDGMKIVAASMTPVIGSAAASKIEALAGKQRLSNSFEVSSLPDANGKNHITAVKGDAKIPVDKIELYMRGKASGDLELLKKEYNSLKDLQISNQKEFAKTLGAREKLNKLNDQIYNVERSQEMARVLNNAGIQDNAKNNAMIMDNLLNSASGVTPSNRETSIVVSGPGGNVRIYATWKLLPDGSKRLATVKTGAFK